MTSKLKKQAKEFYALYSTGATLAFSVWVFISVPKLWALTVEYINSLISLVP